jgi:hypothetical protein
VHDLERIVRDELDRCKGRPVAQNGSIPLDDDRASVELE